MNCQVCGIQAPTRHVTFYQNIGALVMRFHRKLEGDLCKSCVQKNFWKMTLITLAIGWLGMISLVVAPIFIILNIVQYVRCLGMPSAPAGASATAALPRVPPAAPAPAAIPQPLPATPPPAAETLTDKSIESLNPHVEQIASRLNAGEDANTVAADMARSAGVTSAQALLYIHALIDSSQQAS